MGDDFDFLGDHAVTEGASLTLVQSAPEEIAARLCDGLGVAHVDDVRGWCLCPQIGACSCKHGDAQARCPALCWYAMNGNISMVSALLAAGADAGKCDGQGRTPEWLAMQFGHRNVLSALQKADRTNQSETKAPGPNIRRHSRSDLGEEETPIPCGVKLACVRDSYELTEQIGRGHYGEVWKAKHRQSGLEVAVKLLKKSGNEAAIDKEVDAMLRVGDEHCVKLDEVFETETEVQLVLELCSSDLFCRLLEQGPAVGLSEVEVKRIMRHTILGLKALHSHGIIHRDLKCENILLGSGDTYKLADFGLAKLFPTEQPSPAHSTGTPKSLARTSTQVGTPGYASPELLKGIPYSYAVDVWGLGVVAYTALSGCTPFPLDMKPSTVQKVLTANYSFPASFGWDKRSEDSQHFIRQMLRVSPDERATLDQLLEHPWLEVADHEKVAPQQSLREYLTNPTTNHSETAAVMVDLTSPRAA